MMDQGKKDFKELSKRAARLLYKGRIWTNWQRIRDMFGLTARRKRKGCCPISGPHNSVYENAKRKTDEWPDDSETSPSL